MNPIKDMDWQYLKKSLVVLLLSLLAGGLLLAGSELFLESKRSVNSASQARLNQMNARYREAIDQLQLIEDYLPAYEELLSKGFVGEENRLQWIETLQMIAKQRKLPPIDYDIKPMQPYAAGDAINTQMFQVFVSELTLKLELRQENDLLQVFDDIGRHMAGKFRLRSCHLQRKGTTTRRVTSKAGLLAECTLGLFTIRPAN